MFDAQVSVSKEGTGFKTVCSIHLPSGASMEGQGKAPDAYGASDEALEHVEKRLRRYKRRLKDHSPQAKAKNAAMFVLENPVNENDAEDMESTGKDEPMIISEKASKIRTLTPGMALYSTLTAFYAICTSVVKSSSFKRWQQS